jgi:hypothetical protein
MRIIHGTILMALWAGCGDSDAGVKGGQSGQGDDSPSDSGRGCAAPHSGVVGANGVPAGAGPSAAGISAGGHAGVAAADGGVGQARIVLPKVYPALRANTPTSVIADPRYQTQGEPSLDVIQPADGGAQQPMNGAINLAIAIRERLYTPGPTEILRIVHELDERTAALDTTPSKHACLNANPVAHDVQLPGGRVFTVRLQCIVRNADSWLAFGFAAAAPSDDADAGVDAGVEDSHGANDFFLIEGQTGGMGGAYRVRGSDVEAWITVADSRVPNNSQVIMHLATSSAAGTTELALAGSGVGFCSAHLKASREFLFIRARTNGALPPGAPMSSAGQYCDTVRVGCFAAAALDSDLGADAAGCRAIDARSFAIRGNLEASGDHSANVTPGTIYEYFNTAPTGVAAF